MHKFKISNFLWIWNIPTTLQTEVYSIDLVYIGKQQIVQINGTNHLLGDKEMYLHGVIFVK
jgi:hypothetical protein